MKIVLLKVDPLKACDRTIILLGSFLVMIGPEYATSDRREGLIVRRHKKLWALHYSYT